MNSRQPVADPAKVPTAKMRYDGIYKGKVVQRTDPAKLGRLRVMVEGVYLNIAVENLPWAWPCTPTCQKGGFFSVPPLDEYVWVMFEAGMADYPVWMGGWWGAQGPQQLETADGRDASAHVDLPTNNFGGQRWDSGLLRLEPMGGIKPEDAPNNNTFVTPLQKYWEFDDRKGLEKIKIADQLDNYFWINTQKGRATWELIQGLDPQVQARKYRGITLNNETEVAQVYTFRGWLITIDEPNGFMELTSPQGYKVRLDETSERLEMWTGGGGYLVLDDNARRVDMRTPAGRTMAMDDQAQQMRYAGVGNENYLLIDESNNTVELRSAGDLNVKAGGSMSLSASGVMNLDASSIFLNCGTINVEKTLAALQAYSRPENAALARKADFEQRGVVPQ